MDRRICSTLSERRGSSAVNRFSHPSFFSSSSPVILEFYPPTQKTTPACRNALRRAGTGFARVAPFTLTTTVSSILLNLKFEMTWLIIIIVQCLGCAARFQIRAQKEFSADQPLRTGERGGAKICGIR